MNITQAQALVRELGLSPEAISTDSVREYVGNDPLTPERTRGTFDREVFERIRERVAKERRPMYVEAVLVATYGEQRARRILDDASVRNSFAYLADAHLEQQPSTGGNEPRVAELDRQEMNRLWDLLSTPPSELPRELALVGAEGIGAGAGKLLKGMASVLTKAADGLARAGGVDLEHNVLPNDLRNLQLEVDEVGRPGPLRFGR